MRNLNEKPPGEEANTSSEEAQANHIATVGQGLNHGTQKNDYPNQLIDIAKYLKGAGLSVIPIKLDGSKAPSVKWKLYQERMASDAELEDWFSQHDTNGIAIVMGTVSGNLELIDLDAPKLLQPFLDAVTNSGLRTTLENLIEVETPSGGRHFYYRCPSGVEANRKLALAKEKDPVTGKQTLIETRGEGGLGIAPGGPLEVHELHKPYVLRRGSFKEIPEITEDERNLLLSIARSFNRKKDRETKVWRERKVSINGSRPGDHFNKESTWDFLSDYDWTVVHGSGGTTLWRRPGKDTGVSATTGYAGDDLLYVFSTNAQPFDSETGYTKFTAYTLLEHDGDFKAAANELVKEGYGSPIQSDVTPKLVQLDVAEESLQSYGEGNLIYAQSHFYLWDGRIWNELQQNQLKQCVQEILGATDLRSRVTSGTVNSIVELIRTKVFRDISFDPVGDNIPVLNGELEWNGKDFELKPHVREHYRLSLIPVEYDPKAVAPRFEQFLGEIFEGDFDSLEKQIALLQYMGLSLTTVTRYEKYLLLIGEGHNGKTVLLTLIQNLVGNDNASAIEPKDFDARFKVACLHKKLINTVPELQAGLQINDAALKAISSGERMTGEEKMLPPFPFRPYCKLWIASNHLPHTRDVTFAFFRRAIILELNRKFVVGVDCDLTLSDKLKLELPGILNWALDGLKSLYTDQQFTEPKSSVAAKEKWKQDVDQVAQFLDDCCELTPGTECTVSRLYSIYKTWVEQNGIGKPFTKRAFGDRLVNNHNVKRDRGTKGVHLFIGVDIVCAPDPQNC